MRIVDEGEFAGIVANPPAVQPEIEQRAQDAMVKNYTNAVGGAGGILGGLGPILGPILLGLLQSILGNLGTGTGGCFGLGGGTGGKGVKALVQNRPFRARMLFRRETINHYTDLYDLDPSSPLPSVHASVEALMSTVTEAQEADVEQFAAAVLN